MAKDYADQGGGSRKQAHTGGGGLPGWLWALIGLSLGLCLAAVLYIVYVPVESGNVVIPPADQPEAASETPGVPPRQKARFKFYDLLPKSEVQTSDEAYKPEPREESPESTARYLIQAGSFRQREDAERRKATIALLGIESSIREVNVEGKGLRYRVQIGPAMGYQEAEKTMRQLADEDIDSFATRTQG